MCGCVGVCGVRGRGRLRGSPLIRVVECGQGALRLTWCGQLERSWLLRGRGMVCDEEMRRTLLGGCTAV